MQCNRLKSSQQGPQVYEGERTAADVLPRCDGVTFTRFPTRASQPQPDGERHKKTWRPQDLRSIRCLKTTDEPDLPKMTLVVQQMGHRRTHYDVPSE